jgi:PAS domain S-box-containing protein
MTALRPFFTHRLIWLAVLVSLGIGALFARTIWTIRNDEWNYARQTNTNLVSTLEKGLVWTLDSFDKSLAGVAREASRPDVWAMPPDLRARVMFDNSLRVSGVGDLLVLDTRGKVILASGPAVQIGLDVSDRDYFQAFQPGGHEGLYVGAPVRSRVSGEAVLPLSRAYYDARGAFAGVVVGVIRLGYFNELFGTLDLGQDSGVNLFRADGVLISRFPYGDADLGRSIAGTPNMVRFQAEGHGSFTGTAAIDKVERLYAFTKVGDYPLIVNVAQSTDTILAKWRRSAWVLGMFSGLLMLGCLGLAVLFVRELELRQQVSSRLAEAEHDLRTILDNVPSMIAYWDAGLRNRFANRAALEEFGTFPQTIRGRHLRDLLSEQRYKASEPLYELALQGAPQRFERTDEDAQGQPRHCMVSYLPDVDAQGRVAGIFVQVTDITERKRMEDELFAEKERMRLTLQSIGDAVVCADAAGRVTYLNPVAERLTGWQGFDAAARSVDEVVPLRSPGSDDILPNPLRAALEQRATGWAPGQRPALQGGRNRQPHPGPPWPHQRGRRRAARRDRDRGHGRAHGAPGPLRRLDRSAQPGAAARPGAAGLCPGTARRQVAGRDVPGPGRLQGRQRHAGPRRGRPSAGAVRPAPERRSARHRHRVPPGGR